MSTSVRRNQRKQLRGMLNDLSVDANSLTRSIGSFSNNTNTTSNTRLSTYSNVQMNTSLRADSLGRSGNVEVLTKRDSHPIVRRTDTLVEDEDEAPSETEVDNSTVVKGPASSSSSSVVAPLLNRMNKDWSAWRAQQEQLIISLERKLMLEIQTVHDTLTSDGIQRLNDLSSKLVSPSGLFGTLSTRISEVEAAGTDGRQEVLHAINNLIAQQRTVSISEQKVTQTALEAQAKFDQLQHDLAQKPTFSDINELARIQRDLEERLMRSIDSLSNPNKVKLHATSTETDTPTASSTNNTTTTIDHALAASITITELNKRISDMEEREREKSHLGLGNVSQGHNSLSDMRSQIHELQQQMRQFEYDHDKAGNRASSERLSEEIRVFRAQLDEVKMHQNQKLSGSSSDIGFDADAELNHRLSDIEASIASIRSQNQSMPMSSSSPPSSPTPSPTSQPQPQQHQPPRRAGSGSATSVWAQSASDLVGRLSLIESRLMPLESRLDSVEEFVKSEVEGEGEGEGGDVLSSLKHRMEAMERVFADRSRFEARVLSRVDTVEASVADLKSDLRALQVQVQLQAVGSERKEMEEEKVKEDVHVLSGPSSSSAVVGGAVTVHFDDGESGSERERETKRRTHTQIVKEKQGVPRSQSAQLIRHSDLASDVDPGAAHPENSMVSAAAAIDRETLHRLRLAEEELKKKEKELVELKITLEQEKEGKAMLERQTASIRDTKESMQKTLHEAVAKGDIQGLKAALEKGVDVNVMDKNQRTPLFMAIQTNQLAIADELIKRGANLNCKNAAGATPLILAAQKGSVQSIELLCRNHADIEAVNVHSSTALITACQKGHSSVVELLLSYKPNPDAQDRFGRTALIYAATKNNVEVIEMLLKAGADPTLQENAGQSALTWADEGPAVRMIAEAAKKHASKQRREQKLEERDALTTTDRKLSGGKAMMRRASILITGGLGRSKTPSHTDRVKQSETRSRSNSTPDFRKRWPADRK